MNKNLFQRVLFAILLFFSLQIILLFVELPLYIQFFFLILTFLYANSFLSLFLMKFKIKPYEFSTLYIILSFAVLWVVTILYDFHDITHIFLLEFVLKSLCSLSLCKNLESFISLKLNVFIALFSIVLQYMVKNFLFNNILAFSLASATISHIRIRNYKYLIILLILSFIYEYYWVYESNQLLNLLNSLNAPIKILFPLTRGFSFIAILDVIVPGIILNFTMEYDLFRLGLKTKENILLLLDEKNTIYFNFLFSSLFVALLTLYSALTNTNRAQSFLCFVNPSCFMGFYFLAYKRSEIKELLGFEWVEEVENSTRTIEEDKKEARNKK